MKEVTFVVSPFREGVGYAKHRQETLIRSQVFLLAVKTFEKNRTTGLDGFESKSSAVE